MVSNWGGERTGPDEESLPELFVYPIFQSEYSGWKFTVEISEFPLIPQKPGVGGSADNVEYLRIQLRTPSKYRRRITHEGIADRIEKFVHLQHEFQTCDKTFDRRFLIKLESPDDQQLLTDATFRELISQLEPFAVVEISENVLLWSQMITNKKQLKFESISPYVATLGKLASRISQNI